MTESPEQIATRLMAPASTSALWTYEQVRALLIEAVSEDRRRKVRSAGTGQADGREAS